MLASRNSNRTLVNYSSYTVNLAWLKLCSTEPQQLESFKLAFLVLLNVPIRTVVTETVTITGHLQLIYNSPCIASIVLNHIVIALRNNETDMKWPMINYMLLCTLALYIQYIHKHICSGKGGDILLQPLIHLMFSQLAQVI